MPSSNRQRGQSIRYGLIAGTIAIVINILLLQLGSALGLQTGHGGLLKFLVAVTHLGPIQWQQSPLNILPSTVWKVAFHFVVGLGMALFYAIYLESRLRRVFTPIVSGLFYALGLWLVNAWMILPVLGMGIAGENAIPLSGMIYFAFAHTAFFVVLSLLYAQFQRHSS